MDDKNKLVEIMGVRIICNEYLKEKVIDGLYRLGVSGFTWWEARGKGQHSALEYLGGSRLCVEVWCVEAMAEKVLAFVHELAVEYEAQSRRQGVIAAVEKLLVSAADVHKFGGAIKSPT